MTARRCPLSIPDGGCGGGGVRRTAERSNPGGGVCGGEDRRSQGEGFQLRCDHGVFVEFFVDLAGGKKFYFNRGSSTLPDCDNRPEIARVYFLHCAWWGWNWVSHNSLKTTM